jgi:hypothetical protein
LKEILTLLEKIELLDLNELKYTITSMIIIANSRCTLLFHENPLLREENLRVLDPGVKIFKPIVTPASLAGLFFCMCIPLWGQSKSAFPGGGARGLGNGNAPLATLNGKNIAVQDFREQ